MTEPRRNQWGQYLLPDPETGEERSWTRASTWSEAIAKTFGLTAWKQRMVAKGVAMRPDLQALAAAQDPNTDSGKAALKGVARNAIETAGGSHGRNLGSALHKFTERVDLGEAPEYIPEPYDRDIAAYTEALAVHGVVPLEVEEIVVVPELGVAGTFDRIVAWAPSFYIADVKTQPKLDYSWGDISIQLALYANASHIAHLNEDGTVAEYEAMRQVNRRDAIVIHLPPGRARCELWLVDIAAGWRAALLAKDVRDWWDKRDLARPFGVEMLGRAPVHLVDSPADETEGEVRPQPSDGSGVGAEAVNGEPTPASPAGHRVSEPVTAIERRIPDALDKIVGTGR